MKILFPFFLSQILIFILLCLFLGNGCSGQKLPEGLPKLYPCKITINDKNGTPMSGVIVSVIPADPTNQWGASGETNPQGVAEISTVGKYSGLSVGKYHVTLMFFVSTKTGQLDEGGEEIVNVTNSIPEAYANFAKTPFHFEMEAKAATQTFQLEK